jgi:hypothetical protein
VLGALVEHPRTPKVYTGLDRGSANGPARDGERGYPLPASPAPLLDYQAPGVTVMFVRPFVALVAVLLE